MLFLVVDDGTLLVKNTRTVFCVSEAGSTEERIRSVGRSLPHDKGKVSTPSTLYLFTSQDGVECVD